jgi:hypothetical protein
MSTAKKLALIAAGYALCIVAGFAAVTVNELRMPADVAQGSPGMVAFGDMILFVLVTGSSAWCRRGSCCGCSSRRRRACYSPSCSWSPRWGR